MLRAVKSRGKDAITTNNQMHLELLPGVLSELIPSKTRPVHLQCLSTS